MTDEPKPLPVSQSDREAAAKYWRVHHPDRIFPSEMRKGNCDNTRIVQAFAAHRIAHTRQLEADNAKLREEGERLLAAAERHIFGDECKAERDAFRTALQAASR